MLKAADHMCFLGQEELQEKIHAPIKAEFQ